MSTARVAGRYARAFLDYLGSADVIRVSVSELKGFHSAIESHPELMHALTTDLFTPIERRGIVEDVGSRLGLSAKTLRLLLLLSSAKRLDCVGEIAERLNILVLHSKNVVPMNVVSNDELSIEDKKKLESKFTQILGKEVEATYIKEPNLIGGLKVTAAGRTFDGSLSGWLTSMEALLLGGNL